MSDQSEDVNVSQLKDAAEETGEKLVEARRDFLKMLGVGAAGLMFGGFSAETAEAEQFLHHAESPYESAFHFQDNLLYMNIGTTGASPTVVVKDFYKDYRDMASNPVGYAFGQQVWRNTLAPSFGCDPYELVFSFNTSDGLCRIFGGIPFNVGDEIIATNMEHEAGESAMGIIVDRYGMVIKRAVIPTNDAYSDAKIMQHFAAQLTPKTKAILFSSPAYLTGTRLPEKQLCMWAAQNGVISIIDAAHLPGMIDINLHDIGCDFLSGAGHKWQCGPGQTGFMYIRNGYNPSNYVRTVTTQDFGSLPPFVNVPVPGYANTTALPTYWPTNTMLYDFLPGLKNGQRNPDDNVAALLQFIGNGSRSSQKALFEVCQMWDKWGRKNIENYIVSLAQYLRGRIVRIWGPRTLSVPFDAHGPSHAGQIALTSFNPFSPGFDYNADLTPAESTAQLAQANQVVATLRSNFNIQGRTTTVPHSLRSNPNLSADPTTSSSPLRISTHLFHEVSDIDRLIHALLQLVPHP